jgi:ComF family protein
MDCRTVDAPYFDFCRVLFPYSGKPKEFLTEYKYGTGRRAASFIATLFCKVLDESYAFNSLFNGIVPVPPRPGKMKTKGWDQVEMIVRQMGTISDLPVRRCLTRLSSKVQKELDRTGRLHNLDGRIRCIAPPPECAVLVDDVMTTGATLNECAKILKSAGTQTVVAIALCYD